MWCIAGFATKSSGYVERTEGITAGNDYSAFCQAINLARDFSLDYLTDPKDDLTVVTLLELIEQGRTIDVKVHKDDRNSSFFGENGRVIIKSTLEEHMALLLGDIKSILNTR